MLVGDPDRATARQVVAATKAKNQGQDSRGNQYFRAVRCRLVRRVPKRGFNNKFALTVATVNVSDLEKAFEEGGEVNAASFARAFVGKEPVRCAEGVGRRRAYEEAQGHRPPI